MAMDFNVDAVKKMAEKHSGDTKQYSVLIMNLFTDFKGTVEAFMTKMGLTAVDAMERLKDIVGDGYTVYFTGTMGQCAEKLFELGEQWKDLYPTVKMCDAETGRHFIIPGLHDCLADGAAGASVNIYMQKCGGGGEVKIDDDSTSEVVLFNDRRISDSSYLDMMIKYCEFDQAMAGKALREIRDIGKSIIFVGNFHDAIVIKRIFLYRYFPVDSFMIFNPEFDALLSDMSCTQLPRAECQPREPGPYAIAVLDKLPYEFESHESHLAFFACELCDAFGMSKYDRKSQIDAYIKIKKNGMAPVFTGTLEECRSKLKNLNRITPRMDEVGIPCSKAEEYYEKKNAGQIPARYTKLPLAIVEKETGKILENWIPPEIFVSDVGGSMSYLNPSFK